MVTTTLWQHIAASKTRSFPKTLCMMQLRAETLTLHTDYFVQWWGTEVELRREYSGHIPARTLNTDNYCSLPKVSCNENIMDSAVPTSSQQPFTVEVILRHKWIASFHLSLGLLTPGLKWDKNSLALSKQFDCTNYSGEARQGFILPSFTVDQK